MQGFQFIIVFSITDMVMGTAFNPLNGPLLDGLKTTELVGADWMPNDRAMLK